MKTQTLPTYPLVRSGGLFVLVVGLAMVLGTLFGGEQLVSFPVFFGGSGLAIALLMIFGGRLALGKPTPIHLAAIFAGIVLQFLLMAIIGPQVEDGGLRYYWHWMLLIVGIHFLPMAFAFGKDMIALGAACIVAAVAGMLLGSVSFTVFGVLDGLLKVVFGMKMLLSK